MPCIRPSTWPYFRREGAHHLPRIIPWPHPPTRTAGVVQVPGMRQSEAVPTKLCVENHGACCCVLC